MDYEQWCRLINISDGPNMPNVSTKQNGYACSTSYRNIDPSE